MDNDKTIGNQAPGTTAQPQIVIAQTPKSMALALILTFFLGPLGLCYATVKGGVIMIVLSVLLAVVTLGLSVLFMWIPCMIWAYIATDKYNKALMTTGRAPE